MARSTQEMTTALRVAGENLQRNLRADSASLFEWAEMAGLSDSEQIARLTVVTESYSSHNCQSHGSCRALGDDRYCDSSNSC